MIFIYMYILILFQHFIDYSYHLLGCFPLWVKMENKKKERTRQQKLENEVMYVSRLWIYFYLDYRQCSVVWVCTVVKWCHIFDITRQVLVTSLIRWKEGPWVGTTLSTCGCSNRMVIKIILLDVLWILEFKTRAC